MLLALASVTILAAPLASQSSVRDGPFGPEIQSREHFAQRGGRRIAIFEKSVTGTLRKGPRRVAVVLPSASYSSRANWDLSVRDYSVMDALAREGWDVFAIDFQGYGKSDSPKKGSYSDAREAVEDLAAATKYIENLHGVAKVDVIGWSWGAQVAGRFAQTHPERVNGLVLYGFNHQVGIPEDVFPEGFLDQPTRSVSPEDVRSDFIPEAHDPDIPEAFADACLRFGNRAPNGALRDYVYGLPLVEPAKLQAPTLLIYGQHELEGFGELNDGEASYFQARRDDASDFFEGLNATRKQFSVVPGGGHAVHLEKPHLEWQKQVTEFLRGSETPSDTSKSR